jgi:hypothetical protein
MLNIKRYPDLETALDKNMTKDVDHVLIRHSYRQGRHILPHVHPNDDEYIISSRGHFRISSEGTEKEFDLDGTEVVVIYYPAGRDHGLEVLGEKLDYFVMRIPG